MAGSFGHFLAAVLLIFVAPFCSKAEADSTGIDPSLVIEQFDICNDGDLLLVPVTVFGKTRMFAVDTGSSILVYDQSFREVLRKRNESGKASTLSGKASLELYDAPPARIGGLSLETETPVACSDLTGISEMSGRQVDGILGMAFLHEHVVRLDFDTGKLQFLTASPVDAGEPLRIWWDGGTPRVRVGIVGRKRTEFTIDTGYVGSAAVDLDLFEALLEENLVEPLGTNSIVGATGKIKTREGRIASLALGQVEMKNVIVSGVPERKSNLLGTEVCRRFTITLDFPNRFAYFKPNRGVDEPFADDIDGMTLVRKGEQIVIKSVKENGPAWNGGLRRGDVLLDVDELDVTQTRLHTLRQRFSCPGRTVDVRLLRDGEIIETDVKLPLDEEKDSVARSQR